MSDELPPEDDDFSNITHALERVDKGKVSAFVQGDKVVLMIRNAPEDLRRLADALEKIGVSEIDTILGVEKNELRGLTFGAEPVEGSDAATIDIEAKPKGAP